MLFKKTAAVLALASLPLIGSLALANSAQAAAIPPAGRSVAIQSPSVSTHWEDTDQVYFTKAGCQYEGAWYVAHEPNVLAYDCSQDESGWVLFLEIGDGIS
jgi:hypothetical protein